MYLKHIQFISTLIQSLPISYLLHNWQICITLNLLVYYVNDKTDKISIYLEILQCNSNS